MAERRTCYAVTYDVRDPKRWRKLYKLIRGYGERLQYSVFRCWLSERQFEKLRWEVEKRLTEEDSVLFIGLCQNCVRKIAGKNREGEWETEAEEKPYRLV